MTDQAEITDPVMLVRISRLFRPGMSDMALYEATRGVWRVGPRRDRARYALTVHQGVRPRRLRRRPLAASGYHALPDPHPRRCQPCWPLGSGLLSISGGQVSGAGRMENLSV